MKVLSGYLIDRETGAGISGKTVAFNNLAGAAITTATTYAQAVSSTTDADGKFEAWFELSPGPVDIELTVSGDEVKVRKSDEMAQIGAAWMSDIQRIPNAFRNGVIDGYLNELAVTSPSGHNIVIATGAAIVGGILFSIENGPMTIVGTANNNAAINPRHDLVTLRQYKPTAAGQDAGRQEVVVTLGSATSVAPATPTGADFTDYPLAVVSTPYLSATKTVATDSRTFTGNGASAAPRFVQATEEELNAEFDIDDTYLTFVTLTITGLNPSDIYDGDVNISGAYSVENLNQDTSNRLLLKIDKAEMAGGAITDQIIARVKLDQYGTSAHYDTYGTFFWSNRIFGVTGVTSYAIPIQLKNNNEVETGELFSVFMEHASAMLQKRA